MATVLGAIAVVAAGVALAVWAESKPAAVAVVAAGPSVEGAPPPRLVVPRPASPAEVLAARPSPLDGRRRSDVPRELLELVGGGDADRAPDELVGVFAGDLNPSGVAFSPDGRYLACGGNDRFARLWDLGSWEPGAAAPACRVLEGHADIVWTVAFSPYGRTLASGSFDGTIILWDVADGRNTGALAGHARLHSLLTYSPDGRTIAAGGDDGTIHRWDVATGQRSDLIGFHTGGVRAVAYSPDGRLLGSAGLDGTVQVFDAATGRRRHRFAGSNNRTAVAFRPDGRVIAAGCDAPGPSVRFWDVETGEPLPALTGHTAHVGDLAYHPLGRLLATGSWDRTARVWDLTDRSPRVLPVGPNAGPSLHRVAVAWSPDGRYLAAARERRYVCLFRIPAPGP